MLDDFARLEAERCQAIDWRSKEQAHAVDCNAMRKLLEAAVAGIFLVLPMAGWAQATGTDHQRAAGLAAYDAGQYAEARSVLQPLASRYPKDFAVQEALGLACAETGESGTALPFLRAAAALEPRNGEAQANLGAALLQLQQAPEAVRMLTLAARLEPRNPGVAADLGHALFLNHEPREAAHALHIANQLQPGNAALLYDEAVALDASQQSAAALEVLAAVPPADRSAPVESLWGDVAEHAGRFQAAAAHMETAVHLAPTEPNVYALTVELLRHWTWQPAKAMADYGIERFPDSRRLRFARGVALYGNTNFEQAAAVFGALLREHPDDATYGDLLGRSCASLGGAGSPDCGALVAFAQAHPANARVAVYAAISLLHKPDNGADLPTAEALLRQSLASDPKHADAWYEMGVLQQQRQQWEASAASLRKAVALEPALAEAHYRLSRAYAHTNQPEAANAELALQKRYAQQEKETADAQLKGVTVFLTGQK